MLLIVCHVMPHKSPQRFLAESLRLLQQPPEEGPVQRQGVLLALPALLTGLVGGQQEPQPRIYEGLRQK